MAWPKLLVLVRHAESVGNTKTADERAAYEVATHNYRLTDRGRLQAEITGTYLKERFGKFDVYYTSYYRRAKKTMRIMCPRVKIYEDPRLAEGQRGIYHTYTKDQIKILFPGELSRKEREGLYHHRPLGGENWPNIEFRIHSFLGTLARDCVGQKVLIVVHGHWLILLQRLIHHFSIREAVKRYNQSVAENASVTIYRGVEKNGKSRLVLAEHNIIPWIGLVK